MEDEIAEAAKIIGGIEVLSNMKPHICRSLFRTWVSPFVDVNFL